MGIREPERSHPPGPKCVRHGTRTSPARLIRTQRCPNQGGFMSPANPASGGNDELLGAGSTYELPASTTSARLARELVRSSLSGFDITVIEVAELLVSE